MNITTAVKCMKELNVFARMKVWEKNRFLSYNKKHQYIEEHITIKGRRTIRLFLDFNEEMVLGEWEVAADSADGIFCVDKDYYDMIYEDESAIRMLNSLHTASQDAQQP